MLYLGIGNWICNTSRSENVKLIVLDLNIFVVESLENIIDLILGGSIYKN